MQVATSFDWSAVPGWVWPLLGGIMFTALEVRLAKAGFVKREDLNGLGERLNTRSAEITRAADATTALVVQLRADLDGTRDRVTRMELNHEALSRQVVTPLSRIEEKMDKFIQQQTRHDVEIDGLKAEVERLKGRPA